MRGDDQVAQVCLRSKKHGQGRPLPLRTRCGDPLHGSEIVMRQPGCRLEGYVLEAQRALGLRRRGR